MWKRGRESKRERKRFTLFRYLAFKTPYCIIIISFSSADSYNNVC